MAKNVLVDAGFLVALLSEDDAYHSWATAKAPDLPPPWSTCEAVLSEAVHLLGDRGQLALAALLRRRAVILQFSLIDHLEPVLRLIEKYSEMPMSLADGCLVRMTEVLGDPVILTTDGDFRLYRRLGRQIVPCILPT
jgi:predicted nucleic acid-binding protein